MDAMPTGKACENPSQKIVGRETEEKTSISGDLLVQMAKICKPGLQLNNQSWVQDQGKESGNAATNDFWNGAPHF